MISYKSCFYCKYAQSNRVSDITIGDFWGLGDSKIKRFTDRPSLILINTERGADFLNLCATQLNLEQRSILEGIQGNGRLNTPPGKNEYATAFAFIYQLFLQRFNRSVQLAKVIGKILQVPKKIIGKIRFYLFLLKRLMMKIHHFLITKNPKA